MLTSVASLLIAVCLTAGQSTATFTLRSPAFADNAALPLAFTGYGDFTSPPLTWSGVPKGTREFALIVEDTDAPTERFKSHWVLYDIPAATTRLAATPIDREARTQPSPVKGASQGLNAMKWTGYLPPRPFADSGAHHYTFTLYALDADLALDAGLDRLQLLAAMKGHILGLATLRAVFERKE